MAHAKRPLFYTGGGVVNSGKAASDLLRELVKLTGYPDHLDADGARRLSGRRSAMDGHARHARHAGSQHGDARLRRDDLHRRALRRPHHRPRRRLLARLEEDPRRYRSVLDQQEHPRRHADRRRLRACAGRHGAAVAHRRDPSRQEGARRLVEADRQMARAQVARLPAVQRGDQAAIRHPAALRADQGPRHLHHHRSRPAPDVGGAVLRLPGAEPLDDLRRARHHGLRPAGLGRRAARASEIAGHRHRRRGLGADDHAGALDRGAVPAADQDLHPQQPIHGHGAAVAGTAARRALFGELFRGAAGFRQAGRGLSCRRHPLREAGRSRPRHQGDDRRRQAGAVRLRGRSEGELLPDDPVGTRAQ